MSEASASSRWRGADDVAEVALTLNGVPATLAVKPRWTLADSLRESGLTGTHLGCEHGVCGACTVLVDDEPVRSCLVLAVQAEGARVETVEALADGDELHAVQRAFLAERALQCGFCTPGFVVLAAWLLRREPAASEQRIREVLSSNLCRCTGYTPILAAVMSLRDTAP
jgi:aerobic-type carbon monoxide dehydrogenase small subunit (CoxS/CutS family)